MPDVEVPENPGMNLTVRDLRPHLSSDAEDLVTEELVGPQHYQMGVIPKHVGRAAQKGIGSGVLSALSGGKALSSGYQAAKEMLTAPVSPGRIIGKYQDVNEALGGEEAALQEAGESLGGLAQGVMNAAAPAMDLYREYRYPSAQAAEAAAKAVAKARRKKERRESEAPAYSRSELYDRFIRPMNENTEIGREIRRQMDKGGPIQMDVPSLNSRN